MKNVIQAPNGIEADKVIDLMGLQSPMPMLRAKTEILDIDKGEVLEIVTTDEVTREDLSPWTQRSGHQYLGEIKGVGVFRYFVRK